MRGGHQKQTLVLIRKERPTTGFTWLNWMGYGTGTFQVRDEGKFSSNWDIFKVELSSVTVLKKPPELRELSSLN